MTLSVIIVNYNVKYFLELCLCSVQAAMKNISGEIIVVDNASADDSVTWLRAKFPAVKFIANTENVGFGKACNTGYRVATGQIILLINPDTLVAEDCFEKCIGFLFAQKNPGIIGVKMLDGSGNFLKESKRAFPTPAASFYKLFGLANLFPKSKIFSKYYLGHVNDNNNHKVEVLAGAFMMMKREVYDLVQGFDEDFFMYGEDIDISYRVQQAGFVNYYFAESPIIHFKGESTQKKSTAYLKQFYGAMLLFVKKHYKGVGAGLFNLLLYAGIAIRMLLSMIGRLIYDLGSLFNISAVLQNEKRKNHIGIVADPYRFDKLVKQLNFAGIKPGDIVRIDGGEINNPHAMSTKISASEKEYGFKTLILCCEYITYRQVISLLPVLSKKVEIKMYADGCGAVAGSTAKDKQGEIIVLQ